MPGPGMSIFKTAATILSEPAFSGAIPAMAGEWFRPPRDDDVTDESLGSFLERRMGTRQVGDNLVSAVMHGIFAGDIYQLSAKSIVPYQWHLEKTYGSVMKGVWKVKPGSEGLIPMPERDALYVKSFRDEPLLDRDFGRKLSMASVFSFKNGIQTLVHGLQDALSHKDNVTIKTGSPITKLEKDETTGKIQVSPCHYTFQDSRHVRC